MRRRQHPPGAAAELVALTAGPDLPPCEPACSPLTSPPHPFPNPLPSPARFPRPRPLSRTLPPSLPPSLQACRPWATCSTSTPARWPLAGCWCCTATPPPWPSRRWRGRTRWARRVGCRHQPRLNRTQCLTNPSGVGAWVAERGSARRAGGAWGASLCGVSRFSLERSGLRQQKAWGSKRRGALHHHPPFPPFPPFPPLLTSPLLPTRRWR